MTNPITGVRGKMDLYAAMKRARFRASMLSKTAVTMADYCKSITTASMCLPLSLGMWLVLLAFVFVSGAGLKSPVS